MTDDFVFLLILYVFSMLLFPLPSGCVNLKMLPFAQNLERMSSYSWTTVIHQSILFNLAEARSNGSVHISIWFMERCNLYESHVMSGSVPRYYNWSMRQGLKDTAINEMLSAPLICTKKELPFVHDNEPMIVKASCNLGLLNKFVVQLQLQDKKRKKPGLKRTAVRKRYAGHPREQQAEEEEEEEEEEEGEEEGEEVGVEEESWEGEKDDEKDEKEVEPQEKEAEAAEQTQSENVQEEQIDQCVD